MRKVCVCDALVEERNSSWLIGLIKGERKKEREKGRKREREKEGGREKERAKEKKRENKRKKKERERQIIWRNIQSTNLLKPVIHQTAYSIHVHTVNIFVRGYVLLLPSRDVMHTYLPARKTQGRRILSNALDPPRSFSSHDEIISNQHQVS